MNGVKHTPGPWHVPHFADDTCTCNCRSVVSECYAGAICIVDFDNGLRIEDGGNDAPPLEQAKANARLIAAAPELLVAAKQLLEAMPADTLLTDGELTPVAKLRAAIAKAEGRA